MKFTKVIKAEDFDAIKEQIKDKAVHHIFGQLEKIVATYVDLGLNKQEIMDVINEAAFRLEEDVDMWADFGIK